MKRVVGLVVLCLLAGGCTSSPPEPRLHPRPSLVGSATQIRQDEGTRTLRAALTNQGSSSVTVTSVSLQWPGFRSPEQRIDGGLLAPGKTIGFTVDYGDPVCGVDVGAAPRFAVGVAGGTTTVPLEVHDPGLLRRLHHRECGLAALDRAVSVSLRLDAATTAPPGGGEYLGGLLTLRRRAGAEGGIVLVDLAGSVLYVFAPHGDRLPLALPPGADRLRVPVEIAPTPRCDGHAQGQASQPFLFAAYVRAQGVPTQRSILVPDRHHQQVLRSLTERVCGFADPAHG